MNTDTPIPENHASRWIAHLGAVGLCALVALISWPLSQWLDLANIVMLFLLAVVAAAVRFGRRPAIVAAFLSVALFDFFFVPPQFSFAVNDVQYLVTFAVMLVVALTIGQLTTALICDAQRICNGWFHFRCRELTPLLFVANSKS